MAVHTINLKRHISTNFDATGSNAIAYVFYRVNKARIKNNLKKVNDI